MHSFLSVRVFGLLSSSLLGFSQRFGRCILQTSLGVPCLSEHRNDSTRGNLLKNFKMISQVESFLCPDKQGTPKEGWRIQRPKRCEKKYEDNNPKALTDKNHQASSLKFRPLKCIQFKCFKSLSLNTLLLLY